MLSENERKLGEVLERAAVGDGLDDADSEFLYSQDPLSKESYEIRWLAQQLSLEATNGKAEVHAQIGLNGSPCGKNCKFCSFAACNGLRKEKVEITEEEVKQYVEIYQEQKANLILMLCTASYSFDKLVHMVGVARSVMDPAMPLLVNCDDMTLEQARQLKAAGANGAYHAVRMREGIDTTIPVETRLATIENLHAAKLSLSTCVEPIGPEHTPAEIAKATRIAIDSKAISAGCGRRITLANTPLAQYGQLTDMANSMNVAVYRLVVGKHEQKLNCAVSTPIAAISGGNLGWAEVGLNPRDLVSRTEKGGNARGIAYFRWTYENAGWEVLDGPSQGWML